MLTDFSTEYSRKTDEELLQLASDRDDLLEDAAVALDAELRRRNLTDSALIEHQTFIKQQEEQEWKVQRRKRSGTFSDRRSLLDALVAFVFGGLILLAYRAIPTQYQLKPDWEQSAASVLAASTAVIYFMGAWRRVEFWVALDISSLIHLLVIRALAKNFPKFNAFSTTTIAVGVAIFFAVYLGFWIWQRNSREQVAPS